jgi:2-polyprenyl-6-methoxyphenol hydroxylase-like FAD-dependent oxidoreductase
MPMRRTDTQVLVVGAGPTGMTLALWLKTLGVDCLVVDKAEGPGTTSRALAVQARTLEFHRQVGIVDEVLAAGVRLERLSIRTPRRVAASLRLADFGEGLSKYSFAFALPQDIHERILTNCLERMGLHVEWQCELLGFEETAEGISARLRKDGEEYSVRSAYLAGCDGAHSVVRHGLGLAFPGGTYEQSFYVADVQGDGEVTRNGLDVCFGSYGFGIIMPVRQTGSLRLIGLVPEAHEGDVGIGFEDIRREVERDTGVTVKSVNWFSAYRVHHRVADKFRVGRVFIAGDAGHIHSPAGGQGMNTGIGDAVNLAWKLAAVLQDRAAAGLLDSYETERIAFARLLIASTDRAFKLVAGRSALAGLWRRHVMPRLAGFITRFRAGRHAFFGLISQTRINYRRSAVSVGSAGSIRAGDRLPYVPDAGSDNFEPLASIDWQVHVYGTIEENFRVSVSGTGIPIIAFPWTAAADEAGLVMNAAYLIRPDGHLAWISERQDGEAFRKYVERFAIRPRPAASMR